MISYLRPTSSIQPQPLWDDHQHLKTKTVRCTRKPDFEAPSGFLLKGDNIEWFKEYTSLGSLLTSDINYSKDIKRHLALANSNFKSLMPSLSNKTLSKTLKVSLFNSLNTPTSLYACKSKTLKKMISTVLLPLKQNHYDALLVLHIVIESPKPNFSVI